jgi:hypothetical protein
MIGAITFALIRSTASSVSRGVGVSGQQAEAMAEALAATFSSSACVVTRPTSQRSRPTLPPWH